MKLKNKTLILYIIFAAVFVAVLSFDLITKTIVNNVLSLHEEIGFIPYILSFRNEHNYGAAWSMFSGQQIMLIVLTFIFIALFLYYIYATKNKNKLFMISAGMIVGGAIGNLVDRLIFGYVRDFLKFDFMNFPIFNIADTFLVIGVVLILIYFLFCHPKENQTGEVKNADKNS